MWTSRTQPYYSKVWHLEILNIFFLILFYFYTNAYMWNLERW